MKREQDARKMELQAQIEIRRLELEAQQREADREAEVRKIEAEISMAELRVGTQCGAGETSLVATEGEAMVVSQTVDNSLAGRTKRFGDALRHVLPHMPSEHADLPQFFDIVEKLFTIYQVPADVQGELLIPILSNQAKVTLYFQTTFKDIFSNAVFSPSFLISF